MPYLAAVPVHHQAPVQRPDVMDVKSNGLPPGLQLKAAATPPIKDVPPRSSPRESPVPSGSLAASTSASLASNPTGMEPTHVAGPKEGLCLILKNLIALQLIFPLNVSY